MCIDGDPKDRFIGFNTKRVPTEGKNGTMIWKDGAKYEGTFKGNLCHGYGVKTFLNSSQYDKYIGTFEDDFFNGAYIAKLIYEKYNFNN